jgi:hypothetical protein
MTFQGRVRSLTNPDVTYGVRYAEKTWTCDCPSARHRSPICKHVRLLKLIGVRRAARMGR